MIDSITGILARKEPTQVVVDLGDVSVVCLTSLSTVEELPAAGSKVKLWTHLLIRDDQIALFGFSKLEERRLFLYLLTVSGVGPRLALVILSGARNQDIRRALIEGDAGRLQAIPRVGAKLAQRLILELQEKLEQETPEVVEGLPSKDGGAREAIRALLALGFGRAQAEKSVRIAVQKGAQKTEEIVRRALRES